MEKRVALVTGASSGIGEEIARQLSKEGYTVYGTSRNAETVRNRFAVCLNSSLADAESIDAAGRYADKRAGQDRCSR